MLINHYILKAPKICLKDKIISDHYIEILNGIIQKVDFYDKIPKNIPIFQCDPETIIIPGFIDLHVHGSNGKDVMDNEIESIESIGKSLLRQGICGFLATTITSPEETINEVLSKIKHSKNSNRTPNLMGIHLEGPFINHKFRGAHNPKYIQNSNLKLFKKWQKISGNLIKQLTIAPEINGSKELISYLRNKDIIISAGHCNISCSKAKEFFKNDISHVTHLYNAMTGTNHRAPGLAMAVLLDEKVTAELIVDKVHLSDDIVSLTIKFLGKDRIVLVTDAISAQGLGDGQFFLGEQRVNVKNNEARLENGTLAGSVLSMNHAVKNILEIEKNLRFEDAILMSTYNPSKKLGISDRYGSIEKGKYANLAIMDKNFSIKNTFLKGERMV